MDGTKQKTNKPKRYDILAKKPVAKFYYQGTHSHPIRRTVLLIEETDTFLRGYEFRCGNRVRPRVEAMSEIKTYRKDRIAKWGDYSRLRMSSKTFLNDPDQSTLQRFPITAMVLDGV